MSSPASSLASFVASRRISFSNALPHWEFECKLSAVSEVRRVRPPRSEDIQEVRALRRIGDPRGEFTDGAVGQLAENVLTFWELRPPLNAKALAVQRVERVMNLDGLGTRGIIFLARAAPVKLTYSRVSAWLPADINAGPFHDGGRISERSGRGEAPTATAKSDGALKPIRSDRY